MNLLQDMRCAGDFSLAVKDRCLGLPLSTTLLSRFCWCSIMSTDTSNDWYARTSELQHGFYVLSLTHDVKREIKRVQHMDPHIF